MTRRLAPLVAAGLGGLAYWLLITTEGAYLGPKAVVLLYDWVAGRYDKGKKLNYIDESRYLGIPLVEALADVPHPRVLDVATGTGRVPLALLGQWDFTGTVVGIDRSRRMLAQAQRALANHDHRVTLLWQDAASPAFADNSFDAVTCLESLEFMPDPPAVLREMMRVLRPGGLLLISNRVGHDAWYFPGKLCGRGRLERYLCQMGMERVDTERWQVHYDLIWAYKPPLEADAGAVIRDQTDEKDWGV